VTYETATTVLAITCAILALAAGAGWGLALALLAERRRTRPDDDFELDDFELHPTHPIRACLPAFHADRGAPTFAPPPTRKPDGPAPLE
jgi:hypothetical protein